MRYTTPQIILFAYLICLFIFWLLLQKSGLQEGFWNNLYSFSFSLIPLLGGLFAVFVAKAWGNVKSSLGRAIIYIGSGLFSWGFGSMVWSYYNFFLDDTVPYPSFADGGFMLAVPLWIIGIVNLSRATGAKFGLRKTKGKIILFLIPLLVLIASYYLLVIVARQGVLTESWDSYLKLFFDLAYPASDVIILTLAVLVFGLSFKYFGGKYKNSIFAILLGFGVMYIADFIFSYTTTVETFYNGNFGDVIFTLALFLITFGVLGFYKVKT